MKNINIVLKGQPKSKYGYLKLAERQNGKTVIKSLNIKVLIKDFNTKTQRIKSSAKPKDLDNRTADEINEILDSKIHDYTNKPFPKSKIKCICHFMKIVIEETGNIGTKEKYQNILNIFQQFIKDNYSKEDLEFEKIDSSVIINFYKYLRTDKVINKRKSKANTTNTANYKMKSFKSFFSKLEDRDIYKYSIDPFTIKFRFEDTKKDFLTIDELNKFLRLEPEEYRSNTLRAPISYELKDIQESFIFSCLSQGLRISDILTLRLNDFEVSALSTDSTYEYSIYINKKMFKTKLNVVVSLDSISLLYIEKQIIRIIEDYIPEYKKSSAYVYFIGFIKKRKGLFVAIDESYKDLHKMYMPESDQYKSQKEELMKLLSDCFNHLNKYTAEILNDLIKMENIRTIFIFPFLNNNSFKNIDNKNDFSLISKQQYLEMVGKRAYINNLLKKLFVQAGIDKTNLSFHSARHTYTTLILDNAEIPMNMHDLQKSLGHNSVISTEKYINSFNTSNLKKMNHGLTSRLKLFDI